MSEDEVQRSGDDQDDLQATTSDLQHDAEELVEVEQTKAELDADDPEVDALSQRAVELTDEMRVKAHAQREIAADRDR